MLRETVTAGCLLEESQETELAGLQLECLRLPVARLAWDRVRSLEGQFAA